MATIDSLANETLCKIMDMLNEPSPRWHSSHYLLHGRYHALRASALVCSRWRDPAQRALFDEVEVYDRYQNRTQQLLATPRPSRHHTKALWVFDLEWNEALAVVELYDGLQEFKLDLRGTLRWNELTRPCFAVTLRSALSDIGPNLQTFIIESSSLGVLESCIDTFPIFKSLDLFSWSSYATNYPLKADDTEHLGTILDAFPSPATLRHLSIGTDDFSSLQHIIEILSHPTLALLTELDFPSLPASGPIDQASAVDAMGKACEDRGIRWSMGSKEVCFFR
ncbi:hypothetical protein RQP46_003198 [Phenoliferia psychrophenolica]